MQKQERQTTTGMKDKAIHEIQQGEKTNWHNNRKEAGIDIDVVIIKSLSFNSGRSVTIAKLETTMMLYFSVVLLLYAN